MSVISSASGGQAGSVASADQQQRPSALIDYICIFNREEEAEARLVRRFPDDDILGSALPVAELTPHADDASTLDPAVSFSVCDTSGNLFHCTRIAVRPESHRDVEHVIVLVSRRPRYRFFQDALMGIKTLYHIGDAVEPHLEQLLFETPAMEARVVKTNWEGVGELTVCSPAMRTGLPEVDDYSMNLLLDSLSPETLTICVESLLKEENVILVSHRPQPLAPCVEAMKSLLYPFQWMGVCGHLVPRDSIQRALSRRGLPFLFGIGHLPYQQVRDMLTTKYVTASSSSNHHHSDPPPKCFLVNLDDGKGEWLNASSVEHHQPPPSSAATTVSSSSSSSSILQQQQQLNGASLCSEHRRMISDQYHGTPRQDKVRLALLQVLLDMFHAYKQHVNSWSTSSTSKREAGFDCEAFLSVCCRQENFDFLKTMLSTRLFGDFVSRVVNAPHVMSASFDRLCKAWPPTELPHAARELLMRRYGYTERGAKAVWARVRHLHSDPNLFSSKKFRDFVSDLGLSKDGPPSTGDAGLDEIVERQARLEALVQRESDKASPPLVLPMIPRRQRSTTTIASAFPPVHLSLPANTSRLSAWIPRRDDPIHFGKSSHRATYFAFCRFPNDDELVTWRSHSFSRPRLHLAFAGGSTELKSSLSEAVKPKPVMSLTCAMKWAQLQGKRSLYDANQVLFTLLMEERTRHREEVRRLRDIHKASSSSSSSGDVQAPGDLEDFRGGGTMEHRLRALEERLREKEQEVDNLQRMLRTSTQETSFSAGVVRKSEPLFSPKHSSDSKTMVERSVSPGALSVASSTSSSVNAFTSPVSTPRRYSMTTSSDPQVRLASPTPMYVKSHSVNNFRVVSPPPPMASSKSVNPLPTNGTTTEHHLKRSASSSELYNQGNHQQQPQQQQTLQQRKYVTTPATPYALRVPSPGQGFPFSVPQPPVQQQQHQQADSARMERNQRILQAMGDVKDTFSQSSE